MKCYVVMQFTGDSRIVFYSYARSVLRSPAYMPLVNCIVSDALVDVTPHMLHTLFQFVNVVHSRLVHSLLDDAPDPVINRVRLPKIRWMNAGIAGEVAVSRAGMLWRCPVERRKIPLIPQGSSCFDRSTSR